MENVAQELESTASALSQIAGPIQDMSIIVEQSFLGEDMPLPFTEEPEGLDTGKAVSCKKLLAILFSLNIAWMH